MSHSLWSPRLRPRPSTSSTLGCSSAIIDWTEIDDDDDHFDDWNPFVLIWDSSVQVSYGWDARPAPPVRHAFFFDSIKILWILVIDVFLCVCFDFGCRTQIKK